MFVLDLNLLLNVLLLVKRATIWQGTVFDDCPIDKIILRHSQFISAGSVLNTTCGTLSRWPIVARSISVVNESYTSQLSVYISENLNSTTIECANQSSDNVYARKQLLVPAGNKN